MTFCVDCMAQKPLRSKHCRACNRCTARFDHHCPWVWNCVGVNNHRQFVVFITTLVVGVICFDMLAWSYFNQLPAPTNPIASDSVCVSWPVVCSISESSDAAFVLAVVSWASLQLIWTVVLVAGQLFQIARQMTTYEVSNLGRYGYMGGRGSSLFMQQGHRYQNLDADEANEEDDLGPGHLHAHAHGHGHRHSHGGAGCWNFLLNVLGFDRFTRGKAANGLARAGKAPNPFDAGIISNCMDFWTKGKEIGVEYEKLYDVPPEGFKKAMERRRRVEDEEDRFDDTGSHQGKIKDLASRYIPGLVGRGPRSNAYQIVSTNETA
ncbi:DHHC palmitoyltransferase-domain-containing protein [Cantharellus anzutake]|uniref:DHHC palmitoyltransferase-domain-containing protein n=1 Tax=Cantharellus anzutake TaxID=1750568 RepID=UPI0019050328|nr:DHHC palmitoyltransferase-domain-containing protein [Cantharellus anzutake]XP_038910920.1 DHHC palmitoyltransferase-domain-containing protein [Cantharellus anzutake]KAF8310232.1 DHHC palmitoyltransferase-domain-containing protein [Cantharellus anzutake]KAF8322763.1 DHHC palmitoyltransferase-domain-containing protein [Cantharellus anzutake]